MSKGSTSCVQDSRPDAPYPSSQIFPSVGVIVVPLFADEEISSDRFTELCRRPEAERGVKPGSAVRRGPFGFRGTTRPDGSRLGPRALLPDQSPRPGILGGRLWGKLGFLSIYSSLQASVAASGVAGASACSFVAAV